MQRLETENEQEEVLMAMGAIYLEENSLLDELFEILEADLVGENEPSAEALEFVLQHIRENFFRLDMNFADEMRADCLDLLQEMWDVHDRSSALDSIQGLFTTGHRTKFNALKANTQSLYKFKEIFKFDFDESEEIQLSDEEFEKLITWVKRANDFVPKCGILAWDVSRYIHLVRMCFYVGYLSDQEAWQKLNAIWPLVDGKFLSWNEYAQSFLIGRTFWAGSEDPELKLVCERLLGHKASPWLNFPIKV